MDNQDLILALNKLIETCKDGEESYKTCAQDALERNSPSHSVFEAIQLSCSTACSELDELVVKLGGVPEKSSSTGDMLHRTWVNLKHAISGKNEDAVLQECERGEESAKNRYNDALEHDLPSYVRLIVERQSLGIATNLEKIRTLRSNINVEA